MQSVDLNFRMNATGNAVPEIRKAQGAVQRLGTQIDKSNAKMRGFNNGITTMQANTRKFAMGGLQQAGYQIGDYAVQVANGTSKMQAFGQQAPQLLQIFGPIGAIVGAGVAIFAAFAVVMQRSKEAAKEAKVEVVSFGNAVGRLEQIDTINLAENLSAPAKAAMSEYSALLDLMQGVAEEQRMAALSKLVEDIAPSEEIAQLRVELAEIGRIRSVILGQGGEKGDTAFDKAFEAQKDLLAELSGEVSTRNIILSIQGKTRDEASRSLATAIESLNSAGLMTSELRAQIQAFAEQNGLMSAVAKKAEDLTDAAEDGADAAAEAAKAAAELRSQMSFATAAARAFVSAISAAPAGLQAMRNQTAVIQAEISAISAGYTQIGASVAAYRKQRELEIGLSEAGSEAEKAYLSAIINKDVEAFNARAKANKQLTEARTKFDELGKSGRKATEKMSKAMREKLSPEVERLKSIQDTVSGAFESGFMSMIDGTKSVKDAFKSMASEIIKELFRIFVVKKITGMISNAIGGFMSSGPTTSLRPQLRPSSFSGGGYTGNGARAGGLDGKGGYMAMIHPRETVVDHTKGQGTGGVTVIQNNTFGNGVSRAEVNAMLPKMVEATKAAVADAKLRGGSYGRSFA